VCLYICIHCFIQFQQYSVVDASEGQVFIAVYHNENHTNLYLSDEEGLYYSLTLEDVVTNEEDDWINGNAVIDVHVVCGMHNCERHNACN